MSTAGASLSKPPSTTAPTRSRAARTSVSSSTYRRCASGCSRRKRSAADMRVGLLGGGVIARLFLEHAKRSEMDNAEVVAIAGRSEASRGKALAREFAAPFVVGVKRLIAARPAVGIGGLDALKAACAAGVDEVSIAVTKPPAAWKGIPYVERLKIDLERLAGPVTLFEGRAREGVPHFPANVNIAAVLSLAGVGFDRTRLKVVADPALTFNTHSITIRGKTGTMFLRFESVPSPDNPKTAMLACYSALAAFRQFNSPVRYGT